MQRAAICGDPDSVAAGLNELAVELGLDCHLVLLDVGGLSHPEALETIQLFGEEVIPALATPAVSGSDQDHQPARLDGVGLGGRRRGLPFSTIQEAIDDIRRGRMVVVCDAADRENEGDLTIAAQFATPEAINFMATHGRGLICLALDPARCDELRLAPMGTNNESRFATPFTTSIEARAGISTGISAYDRARTIQVAVDPAASPRDLVCPGHIFPLRARSNGVLERTGQTEAAVDLARLAGLTPAGVICEVMKHDGTMARVPNLQAYCAAHRLKMVTIADLIAYRLDHAA